VSYDLAGLNTWAVRRVEMAPGYIPAVVPAPGQVVSVVLQTSTFGVLCVCFSKPSKLSITVSIAA
jgi:hypothetical protein